MGGGLRFSRHRFLPLCFWHPSVSACLSQEAGLIIKQLCKVMGTLWTLQSSQPGLSFYSALPLAYGTAYYAISLGSNVVLTILIMARLLIYRRTITKSMGFSTEHTRDYTSLATIVIESASLYSVFAILFLITYAINNPMNQIFLGIANPAQVSTYSISSVFPLKSFMLCSKFPIT